MKSEYIATAYHSYSVYIVNLYIIIYLNTKSIIWSTYIVLAKC